MYIPLWSCAVSGHLTPCLQSPCHLGQVFLLLVYQRLFWGVVGTCMCLIFHMVRSTTASKLCIVLFCSPDDRSQTILPLVKSFCEKSFKADESILISLSFHLGKLCHGLYGMLPGGCETAALLFCPTHFSQLFSGSTCFPVCSLRRT